MVGLAFGFDFVVVLEEFLERERGSIIHLEHTTFGWNWARRAREPM